MSVYWVAMWSVRPDAIAKHDEEALPALLKHVREEHPRVLSVRTWAVRWRGRASTTRAGMDGGVCQPDLD